MSPANIDWPQKSGSGIRWKMSTGHSLLHSTRCGQAHDKNTSKVIYKTVIVVISKFLKHYFKFKQPSYSRVLNPSLCHTIHMEIIQSNCYSNDRPHCFRLCPHPHSDHRLSVHGAAERPRSQTGHSYKAGHQPDNLKRTSDTTISRHTFSQHEL